MRLLVLHILIFGAVACAPPPPLAPAQARHATLAEFTRTLRDAAARHDLAALREMMAPDFSSAFVGPSNPDIAVAAWRSENFRSLDEMVKLLDEGLVLQRPDLWVAPEAYRTTAGYRGLRTGVGRGADGGWVWLFLVRGEG